jgi:hypothetical protein
LNITLEAAESIADAADASIYEDYSGRGMYGTKCLGFVVNGHRGEAALSIAIIRTLGEDDAEDMLDNLRADALGLGTIIYFPGINATPC